MMRTTLLALGLTILVAATAAAQVPQAFNYQAVARDNTGAVLPNAQVSIRFTITNVGSTAALYVEEHTATTNEFGLLTLAVGQGTAVTGTFAGIDWTGAPKSLGVEINTGAEYVSLGDAALLSVPYALAAGSVASTTALNDLDDVSTQGVQDGDGIVFNGTSWVPGTPAVTLSFPIAAAVNTDQLTPALDLTQGGAGSLLRLRATDNIAITPAAEIVSIAQAPALVVRNIGDNASAANFETSSPSTGAATIQARTSGVGNVGWFLLDNANSDSAAVRAETRGTGAALYGEASAAGRAWGVYGLALGECVTDRGGVNLICPAGVFGEARRGPGVFGRNRGTGPGVQGYSMNGKSFLGLGPSSVSGSPMMVSFVDNEGNGYNRGDLRTPASVTSTRNAMATRFTPGDTGVAPGDVIVVNQGGAFVESIDGASAAVIGVAVADAAVVTATTFDDDGEPSNVAGSRLFAYAGIVTINVDNSAGPIVPGDLLITSRSNPGHAMLGGTDPAAGTVIAKALESYSAAGTGQIRALVMLR